MWASAPWTGMPSVAADDLRAALDALARSVGGGAVRVLGGPASLRPPRVFSSGVPALDKALGVGGFAGGRLAEIFGPEGAGKTTILVAALAACQRQDRRPVAFVEAEPFFDGPGLAYARRLGLATDRLLVVCHDTAEQALGAAVALVESGEIAALALDSVAALLPQAERDAELGRTDGLEQARVLAGALRRLSPAALASDCALLFANQLRGSDEDERTPGGRALRHYAAVRVRVEAAGFIMRRDGSAAGQVVSARVAKNKLAPPFREAKFDLWFGQGFEKKDNNDANSGSR